MKIIAIGDTHGRPFWNHIVENETFDKLIFMGDYFDSNEGICPMEQLYNFEDIIAYKQENPDKVELLFGNHDYHYLKFVAERYSGFQEEYALIFGKHLAFALNLELLKMCFATEKYLFSHAGITKTWANNNHVDLNNVVESVNNLFTQKWDTFKFTMGENEGLSGDDICQSPIWVRPNSLRKDGIDGFIQVVGHTPQTEIILSDDFIFIDALGEKQQYLTTTEGQCSVGTIPVFTIKDNNTK